MKEGSKEGRKERMREGGEVKVCGREDERVRKLIKKGWKEGRTGRTRRKMM